MRGTNKTIISASAAGDSLGFPRIQSSRIGGSAADIWLEQITYARFLGAAMHDGYLEFPRNDRFPSFIPYLSNKMILLDHWFFSLDIDLWTPRHFRTRVPAKSFNLFSSVHFLFVK